MNESSPAGSELSRRSLVRTAATAAAAGGALALAGPAVTAQAAARPERPSADRAGQQVPAADADGRYEAGDGVMVRVIDVRTGTLELYTGDGHRTVVDRALAVQIARLGRR